MGTIAKRQPGEPDESAAAWPIAKILSWVVLALGTATAGFTIFLVIRSLTPVLYVDQWSIINHLLLNNKVSFGASWHQVHGALTGYMGALGGSSNGHVLCVGSDRTPREATLDVLCLDGWFSTQHHHSSLR